MPGSRQIKQLIGKTIAQIAQARHVSPEDAIVDLVIEDDAGVGAAYTISDPYLFTLASASDIYRILENWVRLRPACRCLSNTIAIASPLPKRLIASSEGVSSATQ